MTIARWTPPLAPRPPAMLVLGCLGTEAPPFPQGSLQAVRERLVAADLDRRLRERTVELAKAMPACAPRTLPKTLRVAVDSSPVTGAGRVEDTPPYSRMPRATWSAVRPACSGGPRRRCARKPALPCS